MHNSPDASLDNPTAPDAELVRSSPRSGISPARGLGVLAALLGLLALILLPHISIHSGYVVEAPVSTAINVNSGDELITLLQEKGLWEISGSFAVPRLILASYPANIGSLNPEAKKKAFFNSLLPAALVAMAEVEQERNALRAILAKTPRDRELVLSAPLDTWAGALSKTEIDTLATLGFKYRTELATELVKRVDVVPLSLLMSQAALESSWGSSRIAREGNNLFGVLTWGDDAIAPPANREGGGRRYADYGSILESIRAYLVMLNRLPSYERFRELRSQSGNPLRLAEGLKNYSERRGAYIVDIKEVIVGNNLRRYDDCFLALPPPPKPRKVGLLSVVAQRLNLSPSATAI